MTGRSMICTLVGILALFSSRAALPADGFSSLDQRSRAVLQTLHSAALERSDPEIFRLESLALRVEACGHYPDHSHRTPTGAVATLLNDLHQGLDTGLRCLAGKGPHGRLHAFHEYQAHRLLSLLENDSIKTFRCVADQMFATAVATGPQGVGITDPLYEQLHRVQHPGVIFDTYRLGGILTRRFDDDVYRDFFHLAEDQIVEHRSGQPLRPANLHRYGNRAALMFHEMVHWLGHQHSATQPDLAHLYETCCFGGSDYIEDAATNSAYAAAACTILKDDELWSEAYHPYRQMRLWHHKGYDQLKARMRADYDG